MKKKELLFKRIDDKKEEKKSSLGINLDIFCKDQAYNPLNHLEIGNSSDESTGQKRRGRPKKNADVDNVKSSDIIKPQVEENNLPLFQTNTPYYSSYEEPTNLIKQTIGELDGLHSEVVSQITQLKNNRTVKGKYKALVDLISADTMILSNRLSAVNNMTKMITDSHNLDLKRLKDANAGAATEEDQTQQINKLYQMYMSMPYDQISTINPESLYGAGPTPVNQQITPGNGGNGLPEISFSPSQITPEMNYMINDNNPYCKECVIVDDNYAPLGFQYIDTRTNTPIPNIQASDPVFLSNLTMDIPNGMAIDINLNKTYDLIKQSSINNMY